MIRYAKLRSGDWGLRSNTRLQPGDTVEVTTKTGLIRKEKVGKELCEDNGDRLYAMAREGLAGECSNCHEATVLVQNAPDSNGLLGGVCAKCLKLSKYERSYA